MLGSTVRRQYECKCVDLPIVYLPQLVHVVYFFVFLVFFFSLRAVTIKTDSSFSLLSLYECKMSDAYCVGKVKLLLFWN